MPNRVRQMVTGSFGYLGKYITKRLLDDGIAVRTLTGHPDRPHSFGPDFEAVPFEFDRPERLVEKLRGVSVVYNTYWVRFGYGRTTYGQAVADSQNLIRAAAAAGVERFVHVSITNPDSESQLPYFRGKAVIEQTLIASGLSYAIVRPTVLFGKEDILLNNIAWLLRRFPVFGVFGDGEYRIQPVYVDDVAALAVRKSKTRRDEIIDAVGPETFSFEQLVRLIAQHAELKSTIVHVSPRLALLAGWLIGRIVNDVVITADEIIGLTAELLVSNGPPTCSTSLSEWLVHHGARMGKTYASELQRHFRRGTTSRALPVAIPGGERNATYQ